MINMNGQKRAILYARVSTKQQEEHGYRLTKQFDDMRDYAARNNFNVISEFQEAYTGTVPFRNRPYGSKVYEAIEAGKVDAVIVHELDRAARGDTSYQMPVDFLVFWRDLQEADVELHSCDEGLVKDGIVTMVEAWQSNEDNRKRRKRSMQGRREKINKGYFPGNGPRCYGYRIVGTRKDTHLEIYEKEAEIVRLIFVWYIGGIGVTEICKRLTKMGVLSYGDKHDKGKKHEKGEWSPGQIYSILKRETYRGVWYAYRYKMVKVRGQNRKKRVQRSKSEWVPIDVPAIIDNETWEKAQAQLKRGRQMAKRNNNVHEYLLARRATCKCGYHIQGKPCHARGKVYLYYRCNGKYNNRMTAGKCDLSLFPVTKVDTVVWAWLESLLTNPEKMLKGWHNSQEVAEKENAPLLHELEQVKRLLVENEDQAVKLLDSYLAGIYDISILEDKKIQLDMMIADLKKRKLEIEQHVKQRTISDADINNFIQFAESIQQYLGGDVDFETKRAIVDMADLTAMFTVENGEKIVYVTCHIGKERLSIDSPTDCSCPNQSRWW
jgi:site-specific DNA recombinase